MNREELSSYIDNSILLGNVVTKNNLHLNFCESNLVNVSFLLGSVNFNGFYVKKDNRNKIHLTYYDGEYEELDLGDCIDIIEKSAFAYCSHIKRVSGETVVKIGANAFYHSNVEEVYFPNLKEIGDYSFSHTKVRDVMFNKVHFLSFRAFSDSELRSFRGDKVKFVVGAFQNCNNLRTLILPKARIIYLGNGETTFNKDSGVKIQIPEYCKIVEY